MNKEAAAKAAAQKDSCVSKAAGQQGGSNKTAVEVSTNKGETQQSGASKEEPPSAPSTTAKCTINCFVGCKINDIADWATNRVASCQPNCRANSNAKIDTSSVLIPTHSNAKVGISLVPIPTQMSALVLAPTPTPTPTQVSAPTLAQGWRELRREMQQDSNATEGWRVRAPRY